MDAHAPGRLRRAQIRWRLASPVLRIAGQGAAAAALAIAAFTLLSVGDRVNETAASVLVAVVFGVATVLQLRQSQRWQHTVELIMSFQSSEVLPAADVWMAIRITSRRPVGTDVPLDDTQHVVIILDYYEFLSSLALRGLVDTPLLLNLRGGTMTRCYDICREYIEARRARRTRTEPPAGAVRGRVLPADRPLVDREPSYTDQRDRAA